MLLYNMTVLAMLLLGITCEQGCFNGYYEQIQDGRSICIKCPQGCSYCDPSYSTNINFCSQCYEGYYLTHEYTCSACTDEQCDECRDKPGYWGSDCSKSCTHCSKCVDEVCKDRCDDREGYQCTYNRTRRCADNKCSWLFGGPRNNITVSSTHAPPCSEWCAKCRSDGTCVRCRLGYSKIQDGGYICLKCQQGCQHCSDYFKTNSTICHTCDSGYFLTHEYNCRACNGGRCGCEEKPGFWGRYCGTSCSSCSECVSEICKDNCWDFEGESECHHIKYNNTRCADNKCSLWFSGPRKSDIRKEIRGVATVSPSSQTSPLITQTTTQETTLAKRQTTIRIAPTMPALPTTQTAKYSQSVDSSDVYILVSVVCVLVLGSIVFLALYFIRRRQRINRRRQSGPSSQSTAHEDAISLSNVQNEELEQEINGDSVEMENENRETYEVNIGGSMSYYPARLLGKGSYGVVYEGRYGVNKNKPVAIKTIECLSDQDAKELLNINKEIKALETLDTTTETTHIIHFIDSYIIKNTVYLAFELANGTLVDYVSPSNASGRISLTCDDVIRGIVAGLNYTHTKGIVHRDLKPENIFIVEHSVSGLKAVLGDFGQAKATTGNTLTLTGNTGSNGYIAPEIWKAMLDTQTVSLGAKCNKASDIYSLGLVVYYAKSLGNHPFGNNNLAAQDSISKGNTPTFQHIANRLDTLPYEDMLKKMLNKNPDDRPTITVVNEQPALWTSDKIIRYLGLKSDEFEAMIKADHSKRNLLQNPNLIPNGNWMNRLPVNIGTYLRSYTLKNRTSPLYGGKETEVRFLLRAIRNTNGHYQAYPQNTQTDMGDYPEGHVSLWLKVCPGLLMHVCDKLGH